MSNHLTVIVLSGCFFSACTSVQPEGTSEFIDSWSESASNSAVSYWYVGEDQGHHLIIE
jgi:hypothetical protein